ncbi:hypothetical protein FHX42_002310 [Saccharopolyspora lacisalsi]|uniref:Uncharacterized protein n=1 Tax=Halosaccharopolyspora lacisalsi TaxID=1000566 RepID=A0A839DV93_9PSEU|nr:hypothetical protein [Halosaccharopolyspora lacisalsi]MBA8824963.1 hypothetical protein [Halosaccharopolyspora lacisalsi]
MDGENRPGTGHAEEPDEHGHVPDVEDEDYDVATGDKVTPEDDYDTSDTEVGAETTSQTPASSTRHLPEDMPP